MAENQTSAFLGQRYAWSKTRFELDDVQALNGGIRIYLHSWTNGPAYITCVAPGGKETKYRLSLPRGRKEQLCQLCIEQDFVTIAPEERAGIPDEARPSITLTNHTGEKRTKARWAGVKDARSDAIYDALRQIGEQTKGKKPIPQRLRPYQKAIFFLALGFIVLALLLLAYQIASAITARWWPDYPGRLIGLAVLCFAGLFPALLTLRWWERRRSRQDRISANPVFLGLLNFLFFVGIVTLPAVLWRMSMLLWGETAVTSLPLLPRFFSPVNNLESDDNARLLLVVIFAAYLLILGAVVAGRAIVEFVDERF